MWTITITTDDGVYERDGVWYWIGTDGVARPATSAQDARDKVAASEIQDWLE